ncbi:hypothetical protein, partial [Salmonella sp. s54395]|uniref:hypothetical protein n=1 Tax=Salmonella sp. s54395 TaxID=3159664 RepID=UPI00397F7C1E
FFVIHFIHAGYFLWKLWPVALEMELSDLYTAVFKPFDVTKQEFIALCSMGKVCTLKNGECYAEEGVTPTGNLSVLLNGKVKVYCGGEFLHHIMEKQFLDSPEWDAFDNHLQADKFQVTLKSTTYCKYLTWQRETLQEYLKNNVFMRHIFLHLIGHDVSKKLTLLTERQWNRVGMKPDIRLSAFDAEEL